jgi:hypothetical protein
LPEEFQKLFEQMMTAVELNDPDNKQKAFNVLEWAKKEQKKNEVGMPDFIRGDFFKPGSSGESTGVYQRYKTKQFKNILTKSKQVHLL